MPVYINLGHLLDTVLLGGHQFHFPRVAGFQNLRKKLILAMLRNLSKISEMVPSSSPASQICSFTIQSLHSPGGCASTLPEMYFGYVFILLHSPFIPKFLHWRHSFTSKTSHFYLKNKQTKPPHTRFSESYMCLHCSLLPKSCVAFWKL